MRRRLAVMMMIPFMAAAACTGNGGAGAGDGEARGNTADAAQEVASAAPAAIGSASTGDTIQVWKDPNCGCCNDWVKHMEENGFTVVAHNTSDMTPIKQKYGVGADLTSCHTGLINGYAIEGHVPADLIRRMLDEKPGIAGLAVPGMPIGSPGMEGAIKQKYDIIAFSRDGSRAVFATR